VRFIAATNGDPEEAVKSGALREDLYYRLRVVPISVPRLQQRPEDIPLLANHFLAYYWRAHRDAKGAVPTIADSAVRALRSHAWPGNVRELQNIIEHAVVLLEPGASLRAEDLPLVRSETAGSATAWVAPAAPAAPAAVATEVAGAAAEAPGTRGVPTVPLPIEETYHVARERLLAEFERRYLTWLVSQAGNNISRAARIADVDRTTLYRLMERHGLQRVLSTNGGGTEPDA
jgi:DNA-binding NtrC family response regulator